MKRSFQSTEDESSQSSRPRKRPGGASRVSTVDKEAVIKKQQEREEEARKAAATRGLHDVVRQHYNAVPQRGRDWRKTDSRIKGLRSFNNWVKSTIIHKFSPNEQKASSRDDYEKPQGLLVLDIGCGKGGDLGKWQQAPQTIDLLVGIDPAEVSIDQARERYSEMAGRSGRGGRGRGGGRGGRGGRGWPHEREIFHAEFFAQDAFGQSIANIPIVRDVGFDIGAPGSRRGGGGFDVVSMMFCMHYAFESEAKARGMLRNVAGSLKKGGRFIGTIPNSDTIRFRVQTFHNGQESIVKDKEQVQLGNPPDEVIPKEGNGAVASNNSVESSSQVSKPEETKSEPVSVTACDKENATKIQEGDIPNESDLQPPGEMSLQTESIEKSIQTESVEPKSTSNKINSGHASKTVVGKDAKPTNSPGAEWGNSIYSVRFPGPTPKDGVFRPPFGWKYSYFMEEAVEEIPEYVVPWEAFRA